MIYEIYRKSAAGQALADALDDLVQTQQITPFLAMRVLYQFDRSMSEVLPTLKGKCAVKGHLRSYRFLDDVYTFIIKDAEIKFDETSYYKSPILKIVACDAHKSEGTIPPKDSKKTK